MAPRKEQDIKVRVSADMKQRIVAAAEARGESESLIVREAITEYLTRIETASAAGRIIKGRTKGRNHTP